MTTSRPANASDLAFIAPSVEAITEFVVETNGFKAEYGQAGGGPMTFVSKRISLKGELRLEFRCEAFNIFNRTVFGTGNSNLDSGDFGQITNQVNDPRQMQFAAKLYW